MPESPRALAPHVLEPEVDIEENLGLVVAKAFAEASPEKWDNAEEDAAWADWQ